MTTMEYPENEPYAVDVEFGPTKTPEDPDGFQECMGPMPMGGTECGKEAVVWAGVSGFCEECFSEAGYSLEDYGVESVGELPDEWTYPEKLSCIVCDDTWKPENDDGKYTDCPSCRDN